MPLQEPCYVISSLSYVLQAVALVCSAAQAAPPAPQTSQTPAGPARVVVTISLESLRIPQVNVELRSADGNVVIARTISDGVGQATIPDVPPGHYVIRATRDGFADTTTSPFGVRPGEHEQVLVEMRLAFVRESVSVVASSNSPTQSIQPVAVSDVLNGAKMDVQPLAGKLKRRGARPDDARPAGGRQERAGAGVPRRASGPGDAVLMSWVANPRTAAGLSTSSTHVPGWKLRRGH